MLAPWPGSDTVVFPFAMCWRHYVELQLKSAATGSAKPRRATMSAVRMRRHETSAYRGSSTNPLPASYAASRWTTFTETLDHFD